MCCFGLGLWGLGGEYWRRERGNEWYYIDDCLCCGHSFLSMGSAVCPLRLLPSNPLLFVLAVSPFALHPLSPLLFCVGLLPFGEVDGYLDAGTVRPNVAKSLSIETVSG